MLSIIRNTFSWLVVLVLLTGCSGKKENDKTDDNKKGDDGKVRPKDDDKKPAGQADFTLTSQSYAEEFAKDKATAAQNKYQNKSVELTGVLQRFALSPGGPTELWMEGVKNERYGVSCEVPWQEKPWKKVLPGQTVTLRGKGPRSSTTAALEKCEILEVKGDPPPTLTPDALTTELAKAREAALKKYDKRYIVLEGEVAKVEVNDVRQGEITLKTAKEKPRILLSFTFPEGERARNMRPGQKIKALGQFSSSSEDVVDLSDTLILDPSP